MKIRTDFVTNSSSSSFLIAIKEPKNCYNPITKILTEVIKYLIEEENYGDTTEGELIKDVKDVICHFFWDDEDDEEAIALENNLKELQEEGFRLYEKEVSYSDSTTKGIFDLLDKYPELFKIVYESA